MKLKSLIFSVLFVLISEGLNAKTILIFNASSHIGKTLTNDLINQKDTSLLLTARTLEHLSKSALNAPNVKSCHLDFSNFDQTNFKTLIAQTSTIDGIVILLPRPDHSTELLPDSTYWNTFFQTCFINPLEAIKVALPKLSSHAKIVIIGGISSKMVLGDYPQSNVLRLAWVAQAKSMAKSMANQGIHVNTIALGHTLTDSMKQKVRDRGYRDNRSYDEQLKHEEKKIPLGKFADPKQVSAVIQFLLSPQSDHITGANIPMDGGLYQGY